ncbi:hypothetical protein [Fictibacillus phosphorivorans]|uniref:hypothetical protein n=1 Tax=Fictibacillus phosphorivorans TaxID=1221500 RepID=UPI00203AF2C4|nr:hypothetical protein [Fictibacillus phosphorivorans]MCM3716936.1 hypothetical protein [Fictibacillus phosphorivorans]MCM3774515.1 hypothetical protein [Fictibacillus phosphorivorans]
MELLPLIILVTIVVGIIGIMVFVISNKKILGRCTTILLGLLAGVNLQEWALFLTAITATLVLEIYYYKAGPTKSH